MPIKEGGRSDRTWVVISTSPDVCKSPKKPVPYPIVAFLSDAIKTSQNVRFTDSPVFHMKSRITTVFGDELGVGGGLKSAVNKGFCRPIDHKPTVRVNGHHVLNRQMATFEMNGATPEGPFNTLGMLQHLGAMTSASVGPSGSIPPGDPAVLSETPAESRFMSGASNSIVEGGCNVPMADAMGMGGDGGWLGSLGGMEGIVGKAQQAYSLMNTDWSNPGSVLGAIGGVAGMTGYGDVARVASLAQQGLALAKTDWSNPGAILGAAMNLAGPGQLAGGMLGKPSEPDPATLSRRGGVISERPTSSFPNLPRLGIDDWF